MKLINKFQWANLKFGKSVGQIAASLLITLLSALVIFPQTVKETTQTNDGTANPAVLIIVMGFLALAPFAMIMLTSFVKISVVLSILRNALGTQQIPPNQVITGLSLILTIFIMTPVVEKMYAEAGDVGKSDAIFPNCQCAKFSKRQSAGANRCANF